MFAKSISYIRKPKLIKRLQKKLKKILYFEQWSLLIAQSDSKRPFWEDFKLLAPPKDRLWADPFLWQNNNETYIFYEELPFASNKGHISCIKLGKDLEIVSNEIVIERLYHLSYPFLFEYQNQLYMLPETKQNRCIEIYHCKQFPNVWERIGTLIDNIEAVDSTLLEFNGRWWLFTNVVQNNGNAYDTLNLYYSNSPLSDQWVPHPKNPIIHNIERARPAGCIINFDGSMMRPSQDCSVRYGYATNFNQIEKITENEYSETFLASFLPPTNNRNILATHTWNQLGNLYVIDAEFWRKK